MDKDDIFIAQGLVLPLCINFMSLNLAFSP